MPDTPDVVTLWRPTGQNELDLVKESGWRAWPPRLPEQPIFYPVLNRWYATKIAREWNVPHRGVGFVTQFDVDRAFLDTCEVHQVGGRDVLEYWIPAEDLDSFNAHILGRIRVVAEYRGPVPDADFAAAEAALGQQLPAAWRAYLQGSAWLRQGWLESAAFVTLYPPTETTQCVSDQSVLHETHPGLAVIGSDGGGEQIVLDLRRDPAPVMLVNMTSSGWPDAILQVDNVADFIDAIENGSFTFEFDPR